MIFKFSKRSIFNEHLKIQAMSNKIASNERPITFCIFNIIGSRQKPYQYPCISPNLYESSAYTPIQKYEKQSSLSLLYAAQYTTLKEKYFGQLDKARDIIITKPNKQGKNKKHQCQQSIEADVMSQLIINQQRMKVTDQYQASRQTYEVKRNQFSDLKKHILEYLNSNPIVMGMNIFSVLQGQNIDMQKVDAYALIRDLRKGKFAGEQLHQVLRKRYQTNIYNENDVFSLEIIYYCVLIAIINKHKTACYNKTLRNLIIQAYFTPGLSYPLLQQSKSQQETKNNSFMIGVFQMISSYWSCKQQLEMEILKIYNQIDIPAIKNICAFSQFKKINELQRKDIFDVCSDDLNMDSTAKSIFQDAFKIPLTEIQQN